MSTKTVTDNHVVTPDEGRDMLDRSARKWLGMSGESFMTRWDAGEFAQDDRFAVQQVAGYLPLARS